MNDCRENISNRLWRNLAWVTEKKTEADVRLPSPGHCRENNSWLCESCPGLRVGAWFCCAIIQYLLDDFSIGEKLKTRWIFFWGGGAVTNWTIYLVTKLLFHVYLTKRFKCALATQIFLWNIRKSFWSAQPSYQYFNSSLKSCFIIVQILWRLSIFIPY